MHKLLNELVIINEELLRENEEKEKRAAELFIAYKEKDKLLNELVGANQVLLFHGVENKKRAAELLIANEEKEKRAAELLIANEEKAKRVDELVIANEELLFQNQEKEKRAAELLIANEEKEKRAAELFIANEEKEKRAAELLIANEEKAKRAAELFIANEEKAKRVDELIIANEELLCENEKKEKRAAELLIANEEKEKRTAELLIANEEKEKRAAELFIANEEKATRVNELVIANKGSEAALKVKTQFIANMSHEIRTPMNGIIGLSSLALNQPISPDVHDYLVGIESSAKSLLTILNDVLDFSKLEAGKVELDQVPFQLTDILSNAHYLFIESAKAKGLELICLSKLDIKTKLIGDAFRINQVLSNLIGNAIKFTMKGTITLTVGLKGMEGSNITLRFSVKDTGIGMSPEAQVKILEPFTQADNSITRNFGGTGLGLYISNELLGLMGSKLIVASCDGQGSTFSFDLLLGNASEK